MFGFKLEYIGPNYNAVLISLLSYL